MEQFIEQLTGSGTLFLPHDREPQEAAWPAALEKWEQMVRLECPGDAPAYDSEAACWGARMVYQACRFLVHRNLTEKEIHAAFEQGFERPLNHSIVYSVDLLLRYLPDLVRLNRGMAEDDPLNRHLLKIAQEWPLSSVGIELAESPPDISTFYDHPTLRQLYLDRVMRLRDRQRLEDPQVRRDAQACLGAHQESFCELNYWINPTESAHDHP